MPSNDVSTPTGSFNSPVMQTKPLERFEKFPELPEKLRLKVWEFACNWQRVVGVLETHEPNGFGDQGLEIATILGSTTRCPAVLGVCKESRTKALSIYTPIDEGIRTKGARYDIPIYMNLEVDILHRGKIPCSTGAAFSFVYLFPQLSLKPLVGAKHLAIDLLGLTGKHNYTLEGVVECHDECIDVDRLDLESLETTFPSQVEQVAACVQNGVRTISVVVDNDEDESEVTLEEWDSKNTDLANLTYREKGALEGVSNLESRLEDHWHHQREQRIEAYINSSPPTVNLVRVKRKPLHEFHYFPKLPVEIQDMIWKHALNVPKCISLEYSTMEEEYSICVNRKPAVAVVNRASRHLAKIHNYLYIPGAGPVVYYTPQFDTVRIKFVWGNKLRHFTKIKGIVSLGVPLGFGRRNFYGPEVKQFVGLQEVVILIGHQRSKCEMELVDIPLKEKIPKDDTVFWMEATSAQRYASLLLGSMDGISKKWKTYQKRRARQGKISPDWTVPTVRIAKLQPICHTSSPYSYSQRPLTQGMVDYQAGLEDMFDLDRMRGFRDMDV